MKQVYGNREVVNVLVINRTRGEKIFDIMNILLMLGLVIVTLYPFIYIVFASMSDPRQLSGAGSILLRPKGFSLIGYVAVFRSSNIYIGYANTLFYVLVGTSVNILMTSIFAYVLSRKNVYWNKMIMIMVVITMIFHGGLIPTFLWMRELGLYDTRAVLILRTMIASWNLIIMRTSFMGIPDSIEESAKIDGANDIKILFRIILPMSKAVLSVMILFYAVQHWNSWFDAMIYLRRRSLYPLQLFLREILILSSLDDIAQNMGFEENQALISDNIKYATIIVSTLPILCVYPFLQKHFAKGVMIGAIKG